MPVDNSVKRFVASSQIIKDLRSVFSVGPVEQANELKTHIGRESVCDFNAQIISSLYDNSAQSLQQLVRSNIRSTVGDDTSLKAAQRLYLNAKSTAYLNSQVAVTRTGVQLSFPLDIAYERNLIGHVAMKAKCYTRVGNTLTFIRPAKIMILSKLTWGVWSGIDRLDAATVEPSWRFGAGGNNRTVNASLSFVLSGAFSGGGLTSKLLGQTTVFHEEEVYPSQTRQLISSMVIDVATPSSPQGRIDTLKFEMERSPYVISYGARTDNVGFFKQTNAGAEDDTNYFEIIEL